MEQTHFSIFLSLGNDRILLPVSSGNLVLLQDWDEPRHCNADWELHLILKGSSHIDVEDRSYGLQVGQAILIAPGQYHRPKAPSGHLSRFTLSFSVRSVPLQQALLERVGAARVFDADADLGSIAVRIAQERNLHQAYSRINMEALLTQLMVRLLRMLELEENRKSVPITSKSNDLTELIDDFFEQNFAASSGEEELANWLHLSRRQLIRILKETYGMNFRQKLIHTRMDYAAWLLRTTDMKISHISSTVGYHSEAAFFQVFRKHYGTSPRQYRLDKQN